MSIFRIQRIVARQASLRDASFALTLLTASVLLTACTSLLPIDPDTSDNPFARLLNLLTQRPVIPELDKFASEDEFKQYLYQNVGVVPEALEGLAPIGNTIIGTSDSYSTTNLQESGVDESDIFKNDGTYIYLTNDSELRIIRAVPAAQMAVVSRLDLPFNPDSLYLHNNLLVALNNRNSNARACVVDVTDREAPRIEMTYEFDGQMVESRLIGDDLHLVLNVLPRLAVTPSDPNQTLVEAIADTPTSDIIPDMRMQPAGGEPRQMDLLGWDTVYKSDKSAGNFLTVILTIDLKHLEEPPLQAAVAGYTDAVYASTSSIYLSQRGMEEISLVSRFDLNHDGPALVGAGEFNGYLLNRYSLGEYKGFLRVATTTGHVSRIGDGTAVNHVYVLELQNGELTVVGAIEDIAPGERIYSARFMGDRGFLVTFKKVDPLFTLDLKDPTAPKVVGELKVPGYSNYIHPLGKNHLLTIGKDTVDMGNFAWYQGVQISIFDLSDFANPVLVDAEVVGERGTESAALQDPHAFNYFAALDMLALPMKVSEGADPDVPNSYGHTTFEGVQLFRVTPRDGVEPLAQIPLSDLTRYWPLSSLVRGIFIGDYLYAVAPDRISALPLDDPNADPFKLLLDE